jgi:zinc transport system substrate-binding protein
VNRGLSILLLLVWCCFIFSSCTRPDQVKANSYRIVTSFYPIYVSVLNITRDIPGVSVYNMTPPQTGCLHDYSLCTTDLRRLEKADIFVVNGAGMESFMEKVMTQYPILPILVASDNIQLLKDQTTGEDNPHVWVSVAGAISQVDNIIKGLAFHNPHNANLYKKNGEIYRKKLEMLQNKMQWTLQGVKNKEIITFHEAFPYFAHEFGLTITTVIEREPGSEPSPKELMDLIKMVKKMESKVLFVEPQYPSKTAYLIARETGAEVFVLDLLVVGDGALDSYLNGMEQNLEILKKALF